MFKILQDLIHPSPSRITLAIRMFSHTTLLVHNTFIVKVEPTTLTKALFHLNWEATMQAKYDVLFPNKTCAIVPLVTYMNVIDCKWVFSIKYNPDGLVQR